MKIHTPTHTHLYSFINSFLKKSDSLSSAKIFRRSWQEIECWETHGMNLYYFLKEVPVVPRLEPCCLMCSNNSLALGIMSLRQRVEQAVLKNSPSIAE